MVPDFDEYWQNVFVMLVDDFCLLLCHNTGAVGDNKMVLWDASLLSQLSKARWKNNHCNRYRYIEDPSQVVINWDLQQSSRQEGILRIIQR